MQWIDGGPIRPRSVPPRPYERGVGGRPTLVHERRDGRPHRPDRTLRRRLVPIGRACPTPRVARCSRSAGAVDSAGVAEIALGSSLDRVVGGVPARGEPSMVLAGGYFGGWIPWSSLRRSAGHRRPPGRRRRGARRRHRAGRRRRAAACSPRRRGSSPTWPARAPASAAPASTASRRWPPTCGSWPQAAPATTSPLGCGRGPAMVDGRGACGLPSGVHRLVASMFDGFPEHIERHRAPRTLSRRAATGASASATLRDRRRTGDEAPGRASTGSPVTAAASAPTCCPSGSSSTSGAIR